MAKKTIYLLPLAFDDPDLLDEIRAAVEDTFDLPSSRLMPEPAPPSAYNPGRKQYHSTAILRLLFAMIPKDALRLLAVTDVDLYVPQLNFVFGEAAVDGKVSIISLHRLYPEFYGEPHDEQLFRERAVKEAIHELGHTFGLRHCRNPHCVMYFSNDIRDTDIKSSQFCGECEIRLRNKLRVLKSAA